jgi:hypothetical protein
MITKKDLIIAVLSTLCLVTALFMVIPTRSSPDGREYDPWKDINDDGIIEMMDFYELCNAYMTSGDPINKTGLLLEILSRINSLNSSLLSIEASLNTRMTNVETLVAELQSKVADLETRTPKKGYISISPTAFNPTYDEMLGGVDTYDFIRSSALIVFRSSVTWVDFSASVQLPHQSIITNMSVWIRDDSNYQINVWLSRCDPQTETANTIASVSTYPPTAKPGKVTLYDDTIAYPIVDNSKFTYNIDVRFQGDANFPGDMALQLWGVLIEYEYQQ